MGDEDLAMQQVVNVGSHILKRRRLGHHFVGYASKCADVNGYLPTGIYQRVVTFSDLFAIMQTYSNLRNAIRAGMSARRLNIYYRVHNSNVKDFTNFFSYFL